MQRSATFSTDRRSSGRLRSLNQKYRVSGEQRAESHAERRNARLEFLESDNYVKSKTEDDDYIPETEIEESGFAKKSSKKRRKRISRKMKSFEAVLEEEMYEAYPSHIPTYLSVAALPSHLPPRHFCSVCGSLSHYTCIRCGMRYCSVKCNATHQDTRCLKWA